MNNISLSVLDEYAMRLSAKQIKMLKEHKTNTKSAVYTKVLNEYFPNDVKKHITLDITDIEYQTEKDVNDFIATLDYDHPELDNVECEIREDVVMFNFDDADTNALMNALGELGIDTENVVIN